MKGIVRLALAAATVAGVAAQPHNHQHAHLHKKHAAEKRDVATVTTVVPATETVVQYMLDGAVVDLSKAEQGIKDGLYIVVGSTTPTFTPPPPASTSATSSQGGQFIELKSSSSSSPPPAATSSSAPAAVSSSSSSVGTAKGLDADFPSGKVKCSEFPADYGALGLPWLKTNLWSSLQQVGSYTPGVLINDIVTPISGGCQPGMFCSHACPPGYQKTQWPETSQGATGQSIGGLWCNSDGYLELTRPSHTKLCEQGAGGITIVSKLSKNCAVCRTDYPATESMVIPIDVQPGGTYPLTNPNSATYYKWQGKSTTAQYYVNPEGVALEDACVWNSPTNPESAGNWAPINIGAGQDETGTTYLSIFPNAPTSTAQLNFNIDITINGETNCYLRNGQYPGGSTTGCTAGFPSGGSAVITFYE